jgi:hypothetical protein
MNDEGREDAAFAGGCLCEGVRYELSARPLFTHACHCYNCQKRTGSAFAMTTFVLRNDLSITRGQPRGNQTVPQSTIYSCTDCQTIIYAAHTALENMLILRPGTLDHPDIAPPQAHIWVNRKQSWLNLPAQVPQFADHYDIDSTWPAESLARLRVMSEPP